MSPRKIGILGGMGPEATILLMQRLLAAVDARDDADHIPLLVDMNPQVPSRIRRLIEGEGEDPGPVLAEMAQRLEAGGVAALAMPCNTAHHYAPQIRAGVTVPFIDMVALSVAHASRLAGPGGTVGLLGSPALRRIGLYDKACAEAGLRLVHPAEEDRLLAAIRAIKAKGPDASSREALRAASADLVSQDATIQLVACTEFSLIAEAVAPEAEPIDTLDLLVEGIRDAATRAVTSRGAAA